MLVGVERLSFNDPNRGQHTKPVGISEVQTFAVNE